VILELGDKESFTELRQQLAIIIYLISLASILIYIRSLIYFDVNPLVFHIAFVTSTLTLSLLLIGPNRSSVAKAGPALVFAWVLALGLTIPLRFPEGIITNYTDVIYELQIVRNMIASGAVTFTAPTSYAAAYAFNPTLELLISAISLVTGLDSDVTMKYAGPFMGVLTIAFLFAFYRGFMSRKASCISLLLAASCANFLFFDSQTLHETLALVFLSGLVYTLARSGKRWTIIGTIFASMVVMTHAFTSVMVSVFFFSASVVVLIFSRTFKQNPSHLERSILRIVFPFAAMTCLWLLWVAFPISKSIAGYVQGVLRVLLSGSQTTFSLRAGPAITNLWIRITGDAGLVLFALTAVIGFILATRKQYSLYRRMLPLAIGAGIIFIISFVPFVGYIQSSSLYRIFFYLLGRAYTYVYFFAAPLSYLAIAKLTSSVRFQPNYGKIVGMLLIALIASAGFYYGRPVFIYDNSAPLNVEDVRFPLQEWKSAGLFVKTHTDQSASLWGDQIAFNYIGGYGEREVGEREAHYGTINITLNELVYTDASPGSIVILRDSAVTVPYYVTNETEFTEILQSNNVFFSSGEVIMIEVT
jgi:hypothetical protein